MSVSTSEVPSQWIKRPRRVSAPAGDEAVKKTVGDVIADVRVRGDAAVRDYSAKFDNHAPTSFRLTETQLDDIVAGVPRQVIADIEFAQAQVRTMATAQLGALGEFEIETLPGVRLGQKNVPVRSVGAYVPGGRYPLLASAHMTIVTAKVAGVQRIAACTPPIRGEVPAATIAAMRMAGADEIYLLGGVQAIAAMALGTESIDAVNVLAGPGNAYVAEAKRQLFGEVGIDLFAGPIGGPHRGRPHCRSVRRRSRPAVPSRTWSRFPCGADHHKRGPGRGGGATTSTDC